MGGLHNYIYRYVRYKPKGIYKLLRVLEDGALTLYARESKRAVGKVGFPINGSRPGGSYKMEKYFNTFYLYRQDEAKLYLYKGKDTLLECIADCSVVKEGYESGNYDDKNLQDLVWEYDYECGY